MKIHLFTHKFVHKKKTQNMEKLLQKTPARLIFILLTFLSHQVLSAQNDSITIKPNVRKVTVFQQGAQMFYSENIPLPRGTTNLVFVGVSPLLLPNSILADAKGEVVVMDIQHRIIYPEQPQPTKPQTSDSPELRKLKLDLIAAQDSHPLLDYTKANIVQRTNSLSFERNVIVNNRMMKGEIARDTLQLFTNSFEFLRQRLAVLDAELLKLDLESYSEFLLRKKLNERIANLNLLITSAQSLNTNPAIAASKPIQQIIVTVSSENATNATIDFNYYVNAAGWTVSYDLRASKETSNIELRHKAAVYQNTGIDWKDAYLTLSTGNPNQNNDKPVMNPFFIDFSQPIAYESGVTTTGYPSARPPASMVSNGGYYDGLSKKKEDYKDLNVEKNDNMTRVEYEIKLKYSIISDNKPHNVAIQTKIMPATYNYSVIPKFDTDVFLIARVTDWEELNLIPGSARIYFDGSYVGESYINPRNTNDTLQLNLGKDKSIVVNRAKVKDKCKEKMLSENKLITKEYEITIRNTKNIPIRIIVEDQMPVTQNKDIKIEYTEKSGGKLNPETGRIIWDCTIAPKDNKKIIFSFEVKMPKDKLINAVL
jgi:uncharacterized protein (TIGR02231 family)